MRTKPPIVLLALLGAAVLLAYLPVARHGFVRLDDHEYVVGNRVVARGLTGDGLRWAFTSLEESNWHPLAWLSHMADVQLFGMRPGAHHLTSLLLHLGATLLLAAALMTMTGSLWGGLLTAALFALHPLHVQSVAWVAERKDVLAGLFWMLTLLAYARYVRRPGAAGYAAVAGAFSLALMSKPTAVTLPLVLMLLDWWPLGRRPPGQPYPRPLSRFGLLLVVEKAPLLALSAVSGTLTVLAQSRGGALESLTSLPVAARAANAPWAAAWYLGKTFWPSGLSVFYPLPAGGRPPWVTALAACLILGATAAVFLLARRAPWAAAGWLWYLVTLLPVIGLIQAGGQAVADRYAYLPLIGIFMAAAWSLRRLASRGGAVQRLAPAAAAVALAAAAVAARVQVGYWRDSSTLFTRAVAVTADNWMALNGLGSSYEEMGRHEEASEAFRRALMIKPGFSDAWNNLGVAEYGMGRWRQAADAFRRSADLSPGDARAWFNLGLALVGLGDGPGAAEAFGEAVRLDPESAEAWHRLGLALSGPSRRQEAAEALERAVFLDPTLAQARYSLGIIRLEAGDASAARAQHEALVLLRPDLAARLQAFIEQRPDRSP